MPLTPPDTRTHRYQFQTGSLHTVSVRALCNGRRVCRLSVCPVTWLVSIHMMDTRLSPLASTHAQSDLSQISPNNRSHSSMYSSITHSVQSRVTVTSQKLSEIGAKFHRLYRKSGSPSKNVTSDFAPKVAKYPKSSHKLQNSAKWGS